MGDNFIKRILNTLEMVKLRYVILSAFGTIIFFAAVYLFATYEGSGLKGGEGIDFWSCLYFSVVTFTSLGYGDLSPIGWGRLAACVEVIAGLGLFGIGVAKLASHKQSYLLNQLYARELQQKLELFANTLQEKRARCRQFAKDIDVASFPLEGTMRLLENVKTEVMKIRALVSFESRNGYLLSGTPIGSITGLLQALSSLLPALVTVAVSRRSRRSQRHRDASRQIIERMKEIGAYFAASSNESVLSEVKTLNDRCGSARSQIDKVTQEVEVELNKAAEEQRQRLGITVRPETPSA